MYLVFRMVFMTFGVIPSESMDPTLRVGDRVAVLKWINTAELERGDIITFYPPIDYYNGSIYIKRIIGVQGDRIQVKKGVLYLNGKKQTEPYVREKMKYAFGPVTVPDGKYFVLGDNRNHSFDSHMWRDHFIDTKQVQGKMVFRYWKGKNK